jgi:hypothetical protein
LKNKNNQNKAGFHPHKVTGGSNERKTILSI